MTVGDLMAMVTSNHVRPETELVVVESDGLSEHAVTRVDLVLSLTGPAVLGLVF